MRNLLDIYAGIDFWRVEHNVGLQGIGSRVSFVPRGGHLYNTFTLRYSRPSGQPTEFQKRMLALADDDYVVAKWTIHAYVLGENVVSVGIVDTKSLMRVAGIQERLLRESPDVTDRFVTVQKNGDDKSTFLVLPWEHVLQQPGVQMTVLKFETSADAFRPLPLPRREGAPPKPTTRTPAALSLDR